MIQVVKVSYESNIIPNQASKLAKQSFTMWTKEGKKKEREKGKVRARENEI